MAATKEKDGRPGKPAGKESQPLIIAKTPAEEQRLKLERLMRNPDKPVPVPERPKEWNPRAPPEFVRDVMGSSAGAGSGEFHVYRHLRRREYQRQDFLDRMTDKQKLDLDYLEKVKENQIAAEERTAKRKKKREKLKQKKLMVKKAKLESKTAEAIVLCVWLGVSNAEVPITPEIVSSVAIGILTSTTIMLKQPRCYFDRLEGLPCSSQQCEVWLVVSRGNVGVQTFEEEETSDDILSKSPYPYAFQDSTSPNFFITKVGLQNTFPCIELPGIRYFQVGADGRCDTTNCNGVLPTGATVRVKYILVDPNKQRIESGTRWSEPITLLTPSASSSIDVSTWKRSGAMVVITVILSCSMAVLILMLVLVLMQNCSSFTQGQPDIPAPPALSQGIRRYNTHSLDNSEHYSNVRI
ncbi:hypothetical protein AAFF_G00043360 [Aldrovandia affinis]|uniref:PRKR-interacting protein 1 n=1 Tax=Aldrovandia affinis TaxID=143900 RepID=A0AAD7WF23_9TELE|nr:hypothetical protein AAFF_G00043360 [Aldrovandia affinis]